MVFRRFTAVALAMTLFAGGCMSPHRHGGKLAADSTREFRAAFGHTPFEADYVLFARQKPADRPGVTRSGDGWRLGTWRLKKGSRLGFKQVNGGLVAVAGADEMPLPPGRYCWHARPGSEPIAWVPTVLAVGTAVTVGVMAVLFIVNPLP